LLKSNGTDPAWLALGTSTYVLTSNGTDAVWAAPASTGLTSGDDSAIVLGSQIFG
jgi:hypothetical protein